MDKAALTTNHSIDSDKLLRRRSPRRELDVADGRAVLLLAETVPVRVNEHLGKEEKLRNQFLKEHNFLWIRVFGS